MNTDSVKLDGGVPQLSQEQELALNFAELKRTLEEIDQLKARFLENGQRWVAHPLLQDWVQAAAKRFKRVYQTRLSIDELKGEINWDIWRDFEGIVRRFKSDRDVPSSAAIWAYVIFGLSSHTLLTALKSDTLDVNECQLPEDFEPQACDDSAIDRILIIFDAIKSAHPDVDDTTLWVRICDHLNMSGHAIAKELQISTATVSRRKKRK